MTAMPNLRVNILDSPDEIQRFWDWLTQPRDWIACDTETTGVDTFAVDFKVRMLQFGDKESGWAIDFQAWRRVSSAALEWLQKNRVTIVFHNSLFDWLALHREGIDLDWSLIGDTFILATIMGFADESRELKVLGETRYGKWASAGQSLLHQGMSTAGWTWATVPFNWQPYPMYGVVDTVITGMYWDDYLQIKHLWSADHALEIASFRIIGQMMIKGLGIDGVYLADEIQKLMEEEKEINARLLSRGITSTANSEEIARALAEDGITLTSRTSRGRLSTAKGVLKQYATNSVVKDVTASRFTHRMYRTYLGGLLESAGGLVARGLIHPDIKPIEAKTSRMSISNPPMQQLPKENPQARNAIIPRAPGEVLGSADYGQIEMRMFAKLTKDEAMCAAFIEADRTGGDFFVQLGKDVYHEPDFSKSDSRRQGMKTTMYGSIYTAGIETMADSAGVEVEELEPIVESLKNRYPALKTLGSELVTRGDDGKPFFWVRSPFGRVIRVRRPDEVRKLPNYLIQGTSAMILKRGMVHADASGLGDFMMLPVHDEILMSAPEKEMEDALHQLVESMEYGTQMPGDDSGVRIPAEAGKIAKRWGEVK